MQDKDCKRDGETGGECRNSPLSERLEDIERSSSVVAGNSRESIYPSGRGGF